MDPRADLLEIYQAALQAVEGQRVVRDYLGADWCPADFSGEREVAVLAVGKAASAMMAGAESALGSQISEGLVVTKYDHHSHSHGNSIEVIESAHPIPDSSSLVAGARVQTFIQGLGADDPVLVLISGGASALVEDLRPGVVLDELIAANQWLLSNQVDIGQMNAVRGQLSRLKAGGLGVLLGDRPVLGLLISDVPTDDPAVIGSGLLTTGSGCKVPGGIPEWLAKLMGGNNRNVERPNVPIALVATLDHALNAAVQKAESLGYPVYCERQRFSGDAKQVGEAFASKVADGERGLWIAGGETAVTLPEEPGQGGRNQHLALSAAITLAGIKNTWVLAAGTDGTDGPTADAGALVDGGTLARGEIQGLSAQATLASANAGVFLDASEDLLYTGPTGTNVMDLLIGIKWLDE